MSIHPVPNERVMNVPLVELIDVARYFDVSAPWLNRVIERKPRQILRAVDGVNILRTALDLFDRLRLREPLAQALVVGVLSTVRNQHCSRARACAVPPGIRRAIERLEVDFANDLSLEKLADLAQLRRSHFASTFRHATGDTPHQYLLRVRLSHARKLIAQGDQAMSLAEIAAASGFFDQAHLTRVFRSFFGTTPAAFRRGQDRA